MARLRKVAAAWLLLEHHLFAVALSNTGKVAQQALLALQCCLSPWPQHLDQHHPGHTLSGNFCPEFGLAASLASMPDAPQEPQVRRPSAGQGQHQEEQQDLEQVLDNLQTGRLQSEQHLAD